MAVAADLRHRRWNRAILVLSVTILLVVAFLILGPRPEGLAGQVDVSGLPLVNASLNGTAGLLLILGFVLVRTGRIRAHRAVMLGAFFMSGLFLVSYVVYHWFSPGPTRYEGEWGLLYFPVLISHILLSTVVLPLGLLTLYRGWTTQVAIHKRIARITLPVWLYVSTSGVLIYRMLY